MIPTCSPLTYINMKMVTRKEEQAIPLSLVSSPATSPIQARTMDISVPTGRALAFVVIAAVLVTASFLMSPVIEELFGITTASKHNNFKLK